MSCEKMYAIFGEQGNWTCHNTRYANMDGRRAGQYHRSNGVTWPSYNSRLVTEGTNGGRSMWNIYLLGSLVLSQSKVWQ